MIAGPLSWSRSDLMMVAVGFQPTVDIIKMRLRRGATFETGEYDPRPPHHASRRDAISSRPLNRGVETHGYLRGSLRDQGRTNPRSIP